MATFEWPLGKLELINSALSQTGDNLCASADDGSVEWQVCSPAYERGLAFVCESHPWSWLTDMRTLVPSPKAPDDDHYDTGYPIPPDCVHIIQVRMQDRPCTWEIFNNQIVVNAQGGPPPPNPPVTPAVVTMKGIFSTLADPVNATPTVILVLQTFVMSGIYRSMKKDVAEANSLWSVAHKMLAAAKSRHDMQSPNRAIFVSRMTASRRSRRPGPPLPRGIESTNWPGR
jgi:hypothetical protein